MSSASDESDHDDALTLGEQFLLACREGDLNDVKHLLEPLTDPQEIRSIVTYRDPESGATPLHMACGNGHIEVAKFLVELPGPARPLFCTNDYGNTPLNWAIQNKHFDIVALLLASYPNLDVLAAEGQARAALDEFYDVRANLSPNDLDAISSMDALEVPLLNHPSISPEALQKYCSEDCGIEVSD